jgi:hypothetical protein
MIQVLAQTLEAGDETNARHLFDVFETLLILVRNWPFTSLSDPNITVGNTSIESTHPSACSVFHPSWL